jgi:FSR family fosmidomycin resistance protein-like MFS transporter
VALLRSAGGIQLHRDEAVPSAPGQGGALTIGAVSAAHFMSHVLQLALAPLLPLLHREFDASFTELGLVLALFYVASGGGQLAAGILVDRFGPHRVLLAGLAVQGAAVVAMAFVPGYWALLPLALLAGLGNSVYHPADLAILSQRVDPARLGRAFSVHVIGGSAGYAVSPIMVGFIASSWGWRPAIAVAGLLALAVWAFLVANRAALRVEPQGEGRPGAASGRAETAPAAAVRFLHILGTPVVLFAFAYFALTAFSNSGIFGFVIAALTEGYGVALALATLAVGLFQAGNIAGVLVGGALADRSTQHHRIAMTSLAAAGLLMLGAGSVAEPLSAIFALLVGSGFAGGIATPSRDVLVRQAASTGTLGRVFGIVYSGFDVGSLLAPLLYGALLDHHAAQWVFLAAALPLFLAVGTVTGFAPRRVSEPAPAE